MNKYFFEGKNYDDAIKNATNELNTQESDLIVNIVEEKKGILKKSTKIEIVSINDLINYLKEEIKELVSLMGIQANLEVRRIEKTISLTIFSDNNSILIGKNGKTIQAIQDIIRQTIPQNINNKVKIIVDVENYKAKKGEIIEKTAKKIAKEVSQTGVEAKLECMNSYERRIVHNALSSNPKVYTESHGEEPNRYIVIKPREN